MSHQVNCTQSQLMLSSVWGGVRGIGVEVLIYPLETVKIQQQNAQHSENSMGIARRVLQQKGLRAFYQGLSPQLLKTCLKQMWCWPMIIGVPSYLQSYGIGDVQQHILTGLSIATVDAAITTPLERTKVFLVLTKKISFSWTHVYKEGWQGFNAYWEKRSINMVTFLVAQQYFRDQAHQSDQALPPFQLAMIGTKVAVITSIVSAPFDVANTLKQADNLNLSSFFSRQGIFKWYRGWPLNTLSLIIHNIASVIVIENVGNS